MSSKRTRFRRRHEAMPGGWKEWERAYRRQLRADWRRWGWIPPDPPYSDPVKSDD